MPEKTAEELRPDGFFITGDLGQIDADGYVSIVGRNKDLIISGGYNIYPKEVELLLDDQEGVLESAVIGVPHPDFGETVVGVLVAQPDVALDLDEISARVAASRDLWRAVFLSRDPRVLQVFCRRNSAEIGAEVDQPSRVVGPCAAPARVAQDSGGQGRRPRQRRFQRIACLRHHYLDRAGQ